MTSTVPYDPYDDDDIDNNPFAEPHETQVSDNPARAQDDSNGEQEEEQTHTDVSEEAANLNSNLLPERNNDKYKLLIKVTGLERVGSLTNKKENPTVKFDVSTNLPTFRKPQHRSLKKTYWEFNSLFKYLNGALPETFVPALPIPSTNYGINNQEDHNKTVNNFQRWFDRVCEDPLVIRNEEVAFFVESDFNTYTPINKSKLPASGLKRKTLKQLAPPYDEVVELAEFRPLVKSVHHAAQDIQAKLVKLNKLRKSLSTEENAFGIGFTKLSIDETSKHSKMYKRFGKTLTTVGDIDGIIATLDMATLYDGLEWIVHDTYVVKEALTNRHLIMRELQNAQQNSKVKQEQARKLRAKRDISPLKVDDAIRQLKLATKLEHDLTLRLQRITANMLLEKEQRLKYYDEMLTTAVKEYTLRKIEYERKKLALLERIRADVRHADENGGLSRLGRGKTSESSILPSQGAHGDSWTGDRRQSHIFHGDSSSSNSNINSKKDLLRSDFDQLLAEENTDSSPLSEHQEDEDYNSTLDARSAASLLGASTF